MRASYTIIGGGPAGITTAWYLKKLGHDVTIIEREAGLGGCHRVRRVNVDNVSLFTEHGPRIYVSNYINLFNLLKEMGADYREIFTPLKRYASAFNRIIDEMRNNVFSIRELAIVTVYYIFFFVNMKYFKRFTVKSMTDKWEFSQKAVTYLDNMCRLTDGAGIDRYTIHELFQLFNEGVFYTFLQPQLPNDVGLFKIMEAALVKKGVQIKKNCNVFSLINKGNRVVALNTSRGILECSNVIMAIPPRHITNILQQSKQRVRDSFMPFSQLLKYTKSSEYETYIPITIYWNKSLQIKQIKNKLDTDWGIVVINMSDYMKFGTNHPQTVVSTSIVKLNTPSKHTGKTATETSNPEELKKEAVRQIYNIIGDLPKPDYVLLSPGVYRKHNKWHTHDSAYILTPEYIQFPFHSKTILNLYNVGTHNEKNVVSYTSIESAVENSISFCHYLYPQHKNKVPFLERMTFNKAIIVFIILLTFVLILKHNPFI